MKMKHLRPYDTLFESDTIWKKMRVTIDFGPFKEGDKVKVDAEDFVESGDDDNVKLKKPKDGIKSVPKKYLEESETKEVELDGVGDKLDAVVKMLEEIETLLSEDDKIDRKVISNTIGELSSFRDGLAK